MENSTRRALSDEAAKASGIGRNSCKGTIREALREVYDKAGDNPPNINQAGAIVMRQLPVSRSRVREVLNEDEFARRRRGPGRKRRRAPNFPTGKPGDFDLRRLTCAPHQAAPCGAISSHEHAPSLEKHDDR
jgi:hypothetical protein